MSGPIGEATFVGTAHASNVHQVVEDGIIDDTNNSSTFSASFLPGILLGDVVPGDVSTEAISTESPLVPTPSHATASLDRPSPGARRISDNEDVEVEGKDLWLSSLSSPLSSPLDIARRPVRGKSLENMAMQTQQTRTLSSQEEQKTNKVAIDAEDEQHDTDMRGVTQDDDEIADGSSLRQLKPYRDLSSASESYIKRRRQRLLEDRARRLGSNCDYSIQEEDTPKPPEEKNPQNPLRLSKRQKTLADKALLKKRRTPSVADDSSVDDAPIIRSSNKSNSIRTSRKPAKEIIGTGFRNLSDLFPAKLHQMLGEVDPDIVGWRPHGRAFRVNKPTEFVEDVIPKYGFKQSKLVSFNRQLNLYGFSRVFGGPDSGSYYHECFLRGRPSLLEGMVRVKVKGGKRPKPTDIAKTQPNFYAMCPLDEVASAHTSACSSEPKEISNSKMKTKKRACRRQVTKKVPSKRRRSANNEASATRESKSLLPPPPSRSISPISFTDEDVEDLPSNFDISSVFEDGIDDMNKQITGGSVATPPPFSRYLSPVSLSGLSIQRYSRAHAGGTGPTRIMPSPLSTQYINTISHQAILHDHVLPPPIHTTSASSTLSSPSVPHIIQSTFAAYGQPNLSLQEPTQVDDIYRSVMRAVADETAASASSGHTAKNKGNVHVHGDMCAKCIERMERLAAQEEDELQHATKHHARLHVLVEEWYSVKGPSAVVSPSSDVEREGAPNDIEKLCLPIQTTTCTVSSQRD